MCQERQGLVILAMIAQSTMDAAEREHPKHGARSFFVDCEVQDVCVRPAVFWRCMTALEDELEVLRLGNVVGSEIISRIGVASRNIAEAICLQAHQRILRVCVRLERGLCKEQICDAAGVAAGAQIGLVTVWNLGSASQDCLCMVAFQMLDS